MPVLQVIDNTYEETYDDLLSPSTPSKSKFRVGRTYITRSRKRFYILLGFLSMILIVVVFSIKSSRGARSHLQDHTSAQSLSLNHSTLLSIDEYSPWVQGAPTQSFRDNLRPEIQYITSWLSAGWNNDVMTYMNLIYLGMITDRVPVVATFIPMHIGTDAPTIFFGDIFDVPRFTRDSGFPLLEWREVKDPQSEIWDDIGCWNTWEAVQYGEHHARPSGLPDYLRLDISYTKAPEWIKMIPGYEHDKGSSFWSLARLAYPEDREQNLGSVRASPLHHALLNPDEHMLCYDYLYYVGASITSEYDYSYSPAWRYVGKHLHFTAEIYNIAHQYVTKVFGLPQTAPLPSYITIHVRHGDFKDWCWDAEKFEDCFAPLSVIARRVNEVRDELLDKKRIHIPMNRVIMTSDESDPKWWAEVEALGWVKMDHKEMKTEEKYGRWYPVILDAAIQASGMGFVGTDRSTFSILSRRRVMDWNDGVTRMFKWGRKGADDH